MEYPQLELTIESLNSQGAGVARHEGKVYFVPRAVPGDKIRAQVEAEEKNYNRARLLDVLQRSPDRVDPPCPYFFECGGCQLQHIKYTAQLAAKRAILASALQRVGRFENPPVEPVIPSPKEFHYRSRIRVHADSKGAVGFYRDLSHEVVEIDACRIADPALNAQLAALRATFPLKPLQSRELRIDGSGAFTQVNPLQNEKLVRVVLDFLSPRKTDQVFDLFAGNGNLTFPIAQRVKKVWAIEKNGVSVAEGMKRAEGEGVGNILWREASALPALLELKRQGTRCDAVVLDPPRRGLAEAVDGVLPFKPAKVVYVSCDPATLARDAEKLKNAGYRLISCRPLDMFPQTAHVESVSLFEA